MTRKERHMEVHVIYNNKLAFEWSAGLFLLAETPVVVLASMIKVFVLFLFSVQ